MVAGSDGSPRARRETIKRLASCSATVNPNQVLASILHTNEIEREMETGTSYWDCFKGTDLRRTEIVCVTLCCTSSIRTTARRYAEIFLRTGRCRFFGSLQFYRWGAWSGSGRCSHCMVLDDPTGPKNHITVGVINAISWYDFGRNLIYHQQLFCEQLFKLE